MNQITTMCLVHDDNALQALASKVEDLEEALRMQASAAFGASRLLVFGWLKYELAGNQCSQRDDFAANARASG